LEKLGKIASLFAVSGGDGMAHVIAWRGALQAVSLSLCWVVPSLAVMAEELPDNVSIGTIQGVVVGNDRTQMLVDLAATKPAHRVVLRKCNNNTKNQFFIDIADKDAQENFERMLESMRLKTQVKVFAESVCDSKTSRQRLSQVVLMDTH
jgi:hypothetical protein